MECTFLSVTFLFTTTRTSYVLLFPSLSLSLSLAIRSRPDAGFSLYYIHIGIYTRGSPWPSWNYRHWRSWAFSGCCAICTRTVRNLKILIVTGARVAQYRVTHAWPNWIVMSKARLKTIYPECIFFFWILF